MSTAAGGDRRPGWWDRAAGRGVAPALAAMTTACPAYLFWDRLGHYRTRIDDYAYIAASRTFARAWSNLLAPHNTHVVPSWRLLSWAVAASAGGLARLDEALAVASYLALALVIPAAGLVVARETRSTVAALAAMAMAGTTSVMHTAATSYSAGQTLWAGLGILAAILGAQGWRLRGGWWRLALSAACAVVGGGFWTVGHLAGPAAAAYLFAAGGRVSRRAAAVPLVASVAAAAVFWAGAKPMTLDPRYSPPPGTSKATLLVMGVSHTMQAIPERLAAGNAGLSAETTPLQGMALSAALFAAWGWTLLRSGRPSPLEAAGAVMILGGYLATWTFRGYLPFSVLRGFMDWYDAVPQLGLILLVAGAWGRIAGAGSVAAPLSRGGALGIVAMEVLLLVAHGPRVAVMAIADVPPPSAAEARASADLEVHRLRAAVCAERMAGWHRRHLAKLGEAESVARAKGIGLDLIHSAFGRLDAPELPDTYDAADLLDLPEMGRERDPAAARAALETFFRVEPRPEMPGLGEVARRYGRGNP